MQACQFIAVLQQGGIAAAPTYVAPSRAVTGSLPTLDNGRLGAAASSTDLRVPHV